jgi:hypothetical protein
VPDVTVKGAPLRRVMIGEICHPLATRYQIGSDFVMNDIPVLHREIAGWIARSSRLRRSFSSAATR